MTDVLTDTGAAPTPTAPATPAAAIPAVPAPAVATPTATPQAPAIPGAPEGYVPSYRLREAREAAQRQAQETWTQKEAEYQARLNQIQGQLQALVGATPPADPEIKAVRDQFGNLYPGLSKLEDRANEIFGMLEHAGDMDSQISHYWQNYGRQTMDRLFDHAATSLGSPLTEEGKQTLHSAFTGFVASSPEMTARYANDPTIVQDFWKAFTSSFIDPARRSASATVAGRANVALPQDTPGGVPRATPAPKFDNLDDRAAAGWALFNQPKT